MADDEMRPITSDRAFTDDDKRAVIKALHVAWLRNPSMRLGQLIVNATKATDSARVFYVEDWALVRALADVGAEPKGGGQ